MNYTIIRRASGLLHVRSWTSCFLLLVNFQLPFFINCSQFLSIVLISFNLGKFLLNFFEFISSSFNFFSISLNLSQFLSISSQFLFDFLIFLYFSQFLSISSQFRCFFVQNAHVGASPGEPFWPKLLASLRAMDPSVAILIFVAFPHTHGPKRHPWGWLNLGWCTFGAPRVFPFPDTRARQCLPNAFPETHFPVGSLKFTISENVFEPIELMVLAVFSSSLFSLFPLCSFCSFSFVFAFPPSTGPNKHSQGWFIYICFSHVFTCWEAKTGTNPPCFNCSQLFIKCILIFLN